MFPSYRHLSQRNGLPKVSRSVGLDFRSAGIEGTSRNEDGGKSRAEGMWVGGRGS